MGGGQIEHFIIVRANVHIIVIVDKFSWSAKKTKIKYINDELKKTEISLTKICGITVIIIATAKKE